MKNIIVISILSLVLFTCKKKEDPEPITPAPTPAPTKGPISGKINHYNQFGKLYTDGLSGATVKIDSTSNQAITNESGKYTLNNISAGIYTLIFSKSGCGDIKLQNLNYAIGDTFSYNADLSDIPNFTIASAYVKDTTWFVPGIYYKAIANDTNSAASSVAIVGKNANMSLSDPSSYLNYAPASRTKSNDFNRFLSYSFLKDTYGFKKNEIVYVKIYPVSSKGASYIDSKLSKPIYTSYGAVYPTTFSLVIP